MRTAAIVLIFAAALSGDALVIEVSPETCATLSRYTPGVDAYGRPVAPADVDGGASIHGAIVRFQIRYPDIERDNWMTETPLALAELDVATGEVRVNGRRITEVSESDVATACANMPAGG